MAISNFAVSALPQTFASPLTDVADLIVASLENLGIEYVFGIPGGAVEPLFNAFARSQRRGGLRVVLARHEAAAAFMADGYARETGNIGVCIATSGPGATNLITGVACAHENNVPLLAITGQPALPSFGRGALQESSCTGVNVIGMFRHCTRYSSLISHVDQVGHKLAAALLHASQAPQGPAHLSIPVDIQRSPVKRAGAVYDLRKRVNQRPALVDETALAELKTLLDTSARKVFLIGGSRSVGEAGPAIIRLAEMTGSAFITTPDGKGFIDPRHPSYRGVFGLGGHESAAALLSARPDLVVAFGTGFGELSSNGWSSTVLNERLVHVDDAASNLMRSPMARLHVEGNILSACERLIAMCADAAAACPPARIRTHEFNPSAPALTLAAESQDDLGPVKPQRLMRELARRCPPETRFLADAGNSFMWAVHCLDPLNRRAVEAAEQSSGESGQPRPGSARGSASWLHVTMDFAPMGWAIGSAVGVARGNPDCPVVCITGDGSYLMSGQEITTASDEDLTVIYVVLNDSAYGMVMHGQRLAGAEPIAFELPKVDYRRLAEAMGIPGHVIHSPRDFETLDWKTILSRKGPTLLDIRIDREEVPPMRLRLKTLGSIVEIP